MSKSSRARGNKKKKMKTRISILILILIALVAIGCSSSKPKSRKPHCPTYAFVAPIEEQPGRFHADTTHYKKLPLAVRAFPLIPLILVLNAYGGGNDK